MTLLAIDPGRSFKGDKSIGAALFDHEHYVERLSLSYEDLRARLVPVPLGEQLFFRGETGVWLITEVVIEDFVNNDRSRGGQRNGTSECIGMVEDRAWLTKTPFTRQAPAALGAAKLHAPEGSYRKLQHLRHEDSAFLHGFEYLVKKGVIEVDLSATM
mgnify:CR=1 FL=1